MFGAPIDAAAEAARDAAFPGGWFAVAFSGELGPLGVAPRRAFGRDLVLWRTADGAAHAANAECPHFGVHMGRGGTVKDDGLTCPIHGLRFDRAGRCLPAHPGKPAPELTIRTYPTHEAGGVILAWRDVEQRAPADAGPGMHVPGWSVRESRRWTLEGDLRRTVSRAAWLEHEAGGQVRLFATPVELETTRILALIGAEADRAIARLEASLGRPDAPPEPQKKAQPGWATVRAD